MKIQSPQARVVSRLAICAIVGGLVIVPNISVGQIVVAEFPFTTNLNNTAVSAIATTSNSLINPAGGSRSANALSYFKATNGTGGIPNSLAGALTDSNYIGFTVTPTDLNLQFNQLTFAFGLSNNTSTINPYTGSWGIFTSITGFAESNLLATGDFSLVPQGNLGAVWQSPSPVVSFASIPALQNVGESTEFRIYFWDNTTTSTGNLIIRFDDISLTATAVPEPSAYALAFACGLAFIVLARLRRRLTTGER